MRHFLQKIHFLSSRLILSFVVVVASVLAPVQSASAVTDPFGGFNEKAYSANNIFYYDPTATDCSTLSSSKITDEQKVAQTMLLGFDMSDTVKLEAIVKKYMIGGVYFNGKKNDKLTKAYFATISNGLPSELIIASDDEGGDITRFTSNIPSAESLGKETDAEVQASAKKTATQLKNSGVTTVLAPVLDHLSTTSDNVIAKNHRSFSTDPTTITAKATVWAKTLTGAGIGVTYKHFPDLGFTTGNSDESYQLYNGFIQDIANYAAPYDTLADIGPSMIMLSNMALTGWGETPVSINQQAVQYIRNTYDYSGPVTTDDLNALSKYTSDHKVAIKDAVIAAYKAGVDAPLFLSPDETTLDTIIKAVVQEVPKDRIEEAYSRVMKYKADLGMNVDNTTGTSDAGATITGDPKLATSTSNSNSGDSNAKKAYQFLIGKGLTAEQSAAIVGNLMQESGGKTYNIDPTITNSIGAFGIAQWLGGRKSNLLAYASQQGKPAGDLNIQLEFLWKELTGAYNSSVMGPLKASTDLSSAVLVWLERYEVPCLPGQCQSELSARLPLAQKALKDFSGLSADTTTSTACASGSDSSASVSISADGYAFPIVLPKDDVSNGYQWPCDPKSYCHHDNTPAFDLAKKKLDDSTTGTPVVAIFNGSITKINPNYMGTGCQSIQYKADNGYYYWYGHIRTDSNTPQVGATVKAGTVIAKVGERVCTGNGSYPHLHIDQGYPKGHTAGSVSNRDSAFVPLINKLYDSLK